MTARRLFLVLLLLHASLYVFLIADRRLPRERETRESYEIERAALSEAAPGGRGSFFHHALFPFARLLEGSSALVLFHLGLFLDELTFLLGVWLLARSLFVDPRTVFFVSVAALGSSLWAGSAGMNFGIFAALPLAVHLGRRFLQTGSPAILFAVLNLAALQALVAPPGLFFLMPVATALILLTDPAMRSWRSLPWSRRHLIAAPAGLATGIPVAVLALRGARSGSPDPFAFAGLLDLVAGVAPVPGFTLFCGFLTLGFAILGLAGFGLKKALHLLGAAVGGIVLLALMAWTPAVAAPLVRLLLVFLAGAGFEAALQGRPGSRKTARLLGTGLLLLAVALVAVSIRIQSSRGTDSTSRTLQVPVLCELLDTSALWAAVAGGLLLLLQSRARAVPLAVALILFLHPLDLFSWKFRMTWILTEAVTARDHRLSRPAGGGPPIANLCAALLGVNALAWIGWTSWRAGRLQTRSEPEVGIG